MPSFTLSYGRRNIEFTLPAEHLLRLLTGNRNGNKKSEPEIIKEALAHPIASPRLGEIVQPGEKICLVISDITRSWQKQSLFLPYLVGELNEAGIPDADIRFLCAVGSHRQQTEAEHRLLLGKELADRFTVTDHDCRNQANLVYLGETSFGTPVWINRLAVESDRIVLTGAAVYHDMVGWGGGKKSILPGIAGYETIMANHKLSLSPVKGEGTHPNVRSGNIEGNPLHADMLEAADMVKPSFLLNVVMDEAGDIGGAVAGDYVEAHSAARRMVGLTDGVPIDARADLIVASAGGFPKDIDLYQASKAISNSKEALQPGGTLILLAECGEGLGDAELASIITDFDDNLARERELRRSFTIAKYTGFLITEAAAKYRIILVSNLDPIIPAKAGLQTAPSLAAALALARETLPKNYKTYVIPLAANVLPIFPG